MKSQILSQIKNINHGFGTLEQPKPTELKADWSRYKPSWKQVHGTDLCEVRTPGQECQEVDALWTKKKLVPVGVITADCVPILISNVSGTIIAAIHAGWKGTLSQITKKHFKHC